MWEVGCLHEPPCTKVKAAEGGTAEERGGDTQVNEGRGAVDKGELLDALGGEELEPASEHGAVCIDGSHELAREADEGERSRVRAEGVGNGAANGARYDARARGPALCAAAGEEMGVDEDEGRRAPEAAPARGEHGGAGAVLSGEAGDDAAEEVVGEAADAVDSIAFFGGGAG
jgi:hypothetical protein